MNKARQHILERLQRQKPEHDLNRPTAAQSVPDWDKAQRIQRFTDCQIAVHGEVHRLPEQDWPGWLAEQLPKRGLHHLLCGTGWIAQQLEPISLPGVKTHPYKAPIADWRRQLFEQIDVAITSTHAGIAETGSLVLRPDAQEPRLMSLVPPVHIALLRADSVYATLAEMIEQEQWHRGLPSNVLLISGPSKTADIEQTLAFGIHGPKTLITLIIE